MSLVLPAIIALESYDGDWSNYINQVYAIFKRDFIEGRTKLDDKLVRIEKLPITAGKEKAFWHLVSEGPFEHDRLPDLRRCERIPWIRPIIRESRTINIYSWISYRTTPKGKSKRIVISLKDYSYIVIIEPRKDYFLLLTAYPVDRMRRVEKLRKEHQEWKKAGGTF